MVSDMKTVYGISILTQRSGAVGFIVSASKHLPETDIWCIIYPLLTPFLKADISSINEEELMENAKTPVDSCEITLWD